MERKKHDLTFSAGILIFSSIAVKIIGAVFKIPLSSDFCLGDLGFGYFSSAYDFYNPIYTLAFSGFPVALSKMTADRIAKGQNDKADKIFDLSFRFLLIAGILGTGLIFLLALPLTRLTDKSGGSFYSLLCLAPAAFFCGISSSFRGWFEGRSHMIPPAISNIIEALGKLVLGLAVAVFVIRVNGDKSLAAAGAMSGITAGTALSALFLWLAFRKNNPDKTLNLKFCHEDREFLRELMSVALPIAIASLSVSLFSLADTLTVKASLLDIVPNFDKTHLMSGFGSVGNNTAEIASWLYGIKSKAFTVFNLVPTVTTALGISAMPIIAESFAKSDKAGIKQNSDTVLKLSAMISFPAGIGLAAIGNNIMALLYSDISAQAGGKMLRIYGLAAVFAGMSIPLTAILQSLGKQNIALVNLGIGIGAKFILNLLLVPVAYLNILGAVLSTFICYAVIFFLDLAVLLFDLKMKPDWSEVFLKPLISAIACGIVAFTVSFLIPSKIGTALSIFSGGIVYLSLLIVFKALKPAEIKKIL